MKKYKPKPVGVHPMLKNLVDVPTLLQRAYDAHRAGDLATAKPIYETILRAQPKHFDALQFLGSINADQRNYKVAYELFTKAIQINPNFAHVYSNRSNTLREVGEFDLALKDIERAIELLGDNVDYNIFLNASAVAHNLNEHEKALEYCDKAIAVNPDETGAYINKGNALTELHRPESAVAAFTKAIELKEDYRPYNNRARLYQDLQQVDLAIADFDSALALKPDDAQLKFNKGICKLMKGDWVEGFEEHEWRWQYSGFRSSPSADITQSWKGKQDLNGKTILIWAEQGLGDTIQFCRYAKMLKGMGATVKMQVQQPLLSLMSRLPGVDRLVASVAESGIHYDYHTPMMTLPMALKTTQATVPYADGYLTADPDVSAMWQDKLGTKTRPRVGIVWSGGLRPGQPELWMINARRNTQLHRFDIFNDLDVDFYSLQKGDPGEQELELLCANGWVGPNIINYASELNDFTQTAGLIDNLDLVITVDTSTAHLSAAMGKPTWVLNRFDTCWRWGTIGNTTPWYSNMRLYRQEIFGNWEAVFKNLYTDLAKLAKNY